MNTPTDVLLRAWLLTLLVLTCKLSPLQAQEHVLEKEITTVLKTLSPGGRQYIIVYAAYRGRLPVIPLSTPDELQIGDLGFGDRYAISVDQVLDDGRFLGYGKNYLVDCGDTSNLVDGTRAIKVDETIFYYDRNETYTTVLGAPRTVRRQLVIADTEYADALQQVMDLLAYRKWSSADGSFTTVGKLVDFGAGEVSLVKWDGKKTVTVPMQKLSKEDQAYVREELKARAEDKKRERERIKSESAKKR